MTCSYISRAACHAASCAYSCTQRRTNGCHASSAACPPFAYKPARTHAQALSVHPNLRHIHGIHSPVTINTTTTTFTNPAQHLSTEFHYLLQQTMAKIMILIAVLVLAASMAEASIYRTTTVTTYETMGDNDQMPSMCRQEMKKASMDSCQEWMRSGRMTMLRGINRDEEQEQQQPPQECCSNLSKVRPDCRCPIMEKMMQDMQQESDSEQQQQQEMVTRAECLPMMCGLSTQRCDIRQQQPSFF